MSDKTDLTIKELAIMTGMNPETVREYLKDDEAGKKSIIEFSELNASSSGANSKKESDPTIADNSKNNQMKRGGVKNMSDAVGEKICMKSESGSITTDELDKKIEVATNELKKFCHSTSKQYDRGYLAINDICQKHPLVKLDDLKNVISEFKNDVGALYFANVENEDGQVVITRRSFDKESLKAADREMYGEDVEDD